MESRGITLININKFRYTWEIVNFEVWFFHSEFSSITSQFKVMNDNQESIFALNLSTNGNIELECVCESIELSCQLSFLDMNGEEHAGHPKFKQKTMNRLSFKEFINQNFIFNNNLLVGGTLTIICNLIIFGEATHHPGTSSRADLSIFDSQSRQEHLDDYEQLLFSEDFSDFKLVVGGEELPVHRIILAIKSRVFAAMFKHDTTDKKSGWVEISDIEPNIVREMLRFVYVGKVNNIDENAAKLLAAADMYELEELKVLCEKEIASKLSVDNIDQALHIADKHASYAPKLKKYVSQFIIYNAKLLSESEKFKNAMELISPSLKMELMDPFNKMIY